MMLRCQSFDWSWTRNTAWFYLCKLTPGSPFYKEADYYKKAYTMYKHPPDLERPLKKVKRCKNQKIGSQWYEWAHPTLTGVCMNSWGWYQHRKGADFLKRIGKTGGISCTWYHNNVWVPTWCNLKEGKQALCETNKKHKVPGCPINEPPKAPPSKTYEYPVWAFGLGAKSGYEKTLQKTGHSWWH